MESAPSRYSNQRDLLRPVDMLVASSLLASGSLLLLISSLVFVPLIQDLRLLILAWPAIFLHFLGWGALAGLLTEPGGGKTDDPLIRRRAIIFAANLIALGLGLGLLILVYREAITTAPSLGFIFGAFLLPFIPVVYGPVVLVHAGVLWWSSGELLTDRQRVLVRAASLVLVTIAALGLTVQLISPENLFRFAPLAGLTVVGYLLAAIGWRSSLPREEPADSSAI